MALHADTMAAWRTVGEDGTESVTLPDTWQADLTAAYDADIAAAGDTAAAKVAELEADNAALRAELQTTKAMNYDLIVNGAPGPVADSDPENSPNNEENEDESADEPGGVDSLFDDDNEDNK